MNNKHYFLFIVKNISCVQFVVSHQRRKIFNAEFFPNYGITNYILLLRKVTSYVT